MILLLIIFNYSSIYLKLFMICLLSIKINLKKISKEYSIYFKHIVYVNFFVNVNSILYSKINSAVIKGNGKYTDCQT